MRVSVFLIAMAAVLSLSFHFYKPSFNGSAPGCGFSGCHTLNEGLTTASAQAGFQVSVTVNGVSSGTKVGGELVDASGTVVDVIETTTTNPFTLTASSAGTYRVNAAKKSGGLEWDSTMVSLSVSDIESNGSQLPQAVELYQNHPNPFNGQTVIRFYLQKPARVQLDIYDTRGALVANLKSGNLGQGQQRILWNGTNIYGQEMPSGMYVYVLHAGQQIRTRKMLLVR